MSEFQKNLTINFQKIIMSNKTYPSWLPNLEITSSAVHESWMEGKLKQGIKSRLSEKGEELMVPYDQLSEPAKQQDRDTVITVYDAILASTPAKA